MPYEVVITEIKYVQDYVLDVWFSDGTYRRVTFMDATLELAPMYENREEFRKAVNHVTHISWTDQKIMVLAKDIYKPE